MERNYIYIYIYMFLISEPRSRLLLLFIPVASDAAGHHLLGTALAPLRPFSEVSRDGRAAGGPAQAEACKGLSKGFKDFTLRKTG